jgi:hypothetical protein
MINLLNTRLLQIICFVLSIGVLASCDKDNDDDDDGRIQLLSFGPTGAMHGDTLRFFGRHLDQVTAIVFTGTNATVNKSDFKQQSSEQILVIVPAAAEKGFVTLKTPQGDIVSKTQLNLEVTTSVATMTPEARPGENITLTGNFLNWVKRVTFANNKTVETFVSKSLNQLVVTVPLDAQTGPLVLYYTGTDSSELQTADTLKVTLPVATAVSPNPVLHQTNVTITGTNLDLAKSVLFAGVTAPVTTFVSQTATQLVVRVPAGARKGRVTLVAASGVQSVSTMELDVVLPAITGLSPNPVDIGANLTITGTNLNTVSSISFVGVTTSVTTFVSQSPTQIVVAVPAGAVRGRLTLGVRNSTLTVQSPTELQIVGSSVAPVIIYDNAVSATWEKWGGWGTSVQDLDNTEQPQSGTKAFKVTYTDAYGGVQFHPRSNFPLPNGFTSLKIAIYGGTGVVAGTKVGVNIKNTAGVTSSTVQLTLVPGAYTTYTINLNDFGTLTDVNELVIQNQGTANITVYMDNIWFQ